MQHYIPLHQLQLYVDMLGDEANEEQAQNLLGFILREVPQAQWGHAKEIVINIRDLYTQMSMRQAECGVY